MKSLREISEELADGREKLIAPESFRKHIDSAISEIKKLIPSEQDTPRIYQKNKDYRNGWNAFRKKLLKNMDLNG